MCELVEHKMPSPEPYLRDRLITRHDSFVVITPREFTPPIPLFCPVCDYLMSTDEDDVSYEEFGCCELCKDTFVYANKKAWVEDGWRPSKELVNERIGVRYVAVPTFNID